MKELDFIEIVYEYYPRNIDSISQKKKYRDSKENKNLVSIIENRTLEYSDKSSNFKSILLDNSENALEFNDATYFEWMDRCYTFEFTEKHKSSLKLLKLFKSIVTSVFLIKCFDVEFYGEKSKFVEVSQSKFSNQKLIKDLKAKLEVDGYTELDNYLVSKKISDINFDDIPMGEFTFFNAFFNSQNF